jgi:hypothetical protein
LEVDEVPGEGGFVAVPELGVVLVDVPVALDGVEDVVGVELEDVLELLLEELVVVGVEVAVQSRPASAPTVAAPCPRFCSRVVFTVEGRLATALLSEVAASWAAAQSWEPRADETASSWAFRLELWSPESRPLDPPQATAKATANPRPPARNARERNPIRV